MFTGILLRDVARDFRVVLRELAPSRVLRNQFARGEKTTGSHLHPSQSSSCFIDIFKTKTTQLYYVLKYR